MGKGMPARIVAVAAAVVLLFLCMAMLRHGRGGHADAGQASRRSGDAIGGTVDDGGMAMRSAGLFAHASRANAARSGDAPSTVPAAGSPAPAPACRGTRRAAFSRLYATHARPADADEAIDAALLLVQMRRDADASTLLTAAGNRWPRDLELAWFAWSQCDPATCDRPARLRRLLELDPGNAVSWMYAVEDAWRRKDDRAIDDALARAARAPGYATHEGVLFLHGMGLAREMSLPDGCVAVIQRAMEQELRHAATAEDIAVMEAENMENAGPHPGYAIAAACRASAAPPGSARRAACLALLPRMTNADTFLERSVGVDGLLDLLPDLPRSDPLREAYRRQQWLTAEGPRLSYSPDSFARMHAEGGWTTLVAMATAQHLWPPPIDWLPDAPAARAKVLGEPPPARKPAGATRE